MYEFSIIIVTWNALHHLKTFLPSVWNHSHRNAEIIIADNASTDGTTDWVSRNYPQVRIITMEKNFGYCGGNNRAAEHARGRYILFLNNDVEVTFGWLVPLQNILDQEPEIAAVQPKLVNWKNPRYFEYAGAAGGYLDRYGYPFCRGRIFDTLEKDTGQYDNARDISWASGAAIAIRKELFLATGGFDESFEFHMEEIDLCWQLWNRGYRVHYCPDSVVYHLGGGSLPTDSLRKVYYNYRNNLKMIWKNSATLPLLPRLSTRLLLDGVALLRALLRFRHDEAFAIFRAHLHFYRSLPSLFSKRKRLKSVRITPNDASVLMPYSLVWHYYIRGRKSFGELPDTEY